MRQKVPLPAVSANDSWVFPTFLFGHQTAGVSGNGAVFTSPNSDLKHGKALVQTAPSGIGMRSQKRIWHPWSDGQQFACLMCLCVCLLISSCRNRGELPTYLGDEEAAQYLERATQIAHVDLDQEISSKVNFAVEPRRIRNQRKDELWDLTLSEAIQTCLTNSRVIRNSGQFLNPKNPLFSNPNFVKTVYDVAL